MSNIRTSQTYNELLTELEQADKTVEYGTSKTNSDSFSGCSYEDAMSYARNGWDAGIEQLHPEKNLIVESSHELETAVYGAFVNIGNYVQGAPDSMNRFIDHITYGLPEATVYIPVGFTAGHKTEKVMEYCQSVLEFINQYQRDYIVRIVMVRDTELSRNRLINEIVVKDINERFVLNNIAFAFHPSFFRRLLFRKLELKTSPRSNKGATQDYNGFIPNIIKGHKDRRWGGQVVVLPSVDGAGGGAFSISAIKTIDIEKIT